MTSASEAAPASRLLAPTLTVVLTLLCFLPICFSGFVSYDDNWNIFRNPFMTGQVSGASFARFWSGPYYALYMPVTYSIWTACAALGRLSHAVPVFGEGETLLNAGVFHAFGLAAHLINVLLAFALLCMLLPHFGIETGPARRGTGRAPFRHSPDPGRIGRLGHR